MAYQFQNFSDFFKILFHNNMYEKAIQQASKKYKIRHYKIQKLKPCSIKNMLKKKSKKQKSVNLELNNYAWAQGQLKVFIWILIGYVHVKKIEIIDMTLQDFEFFTEIFDEYSVDFLNYQAKFLLKSSQKVIWTQQQAQLLNQIIKLKFQQKNWNTVAYQLYLISGKTVFRTPKQCRQRWLNHQDPSKIHSNWTVEQDIQLLRFVKCIGKKWSAISKQLKQSRTEHMVKNRYTSLLRKAEKTIRNSQQAAVLEQLLKLKITQQAQIQIQGKQESMICEIDEKSPSQQSVDLQQVQNQEIFESLNSKKQIQTFKQLDELLPINLIIDCQHYDQHPKGLIEVEDSIDFFEKDNVFQTSNYLEFFY